jgi:hypothetical protein
MTATEFTVTCEFCGATHVAEYSHEGRYGEGPIYAVACTRDLVNDYVTAERVTAAPTAAR